MWRSCWDAKVRRVRREYLCIHLWLEYIAASWEVGKLLRSWEYAASCKLHSASFAICEHQCQQCQPDANQA
eukprot:3388794-Amphidinium_carterae.1